MKPAFIHIIYDNQNFNTLAIKFFSLLFIKYGVPVFILGKDLHKNIISNAEALKKLGIHGIELKNSLYDADKYIFKIAESYTICAINTTFNPFVEQISVIQEKLGIGITSFHPLLNDKFMQRELIQKNSPSIAVKFCKHKILEIDYEKMTYFFGKSSFIVKPLSRAESQGVVKISSLEDLQKLQKKNKENSEEYLIEEYFPGECYSIDYFIDNESNISYGVVIRNALGEEIGSGVFSIVSVQTEGINLTNKDYIKLEKLVQSTVGALNIKNTFICQDIILTPEGDFQSLELNGRIGGPHSEVVYEGFGISLPSLCINKRPALQIVPIKTHVASYKIYAHKAGILESYNDSIIEQIKSLPSFSFIELSSGYIGKKTGLLEDGYSNVGRFFMKHTDENQLKSDIEFINQNYENLLIIK